MSTLCLVPSWAFGIHSDLSYTLALLAQTSSWGGKLYASEQIRPPGVDKFVEGKQSRAWLGLPPRGESASPSASRPVHARSLALQ